MNPINLPGWPGKTPPTRAILQVLKALFVVSDRGTGCDVDEVRDVLVLFGMTEDEADRAMDDAEECGVVYFGGAA